MMWSVTKLKNALHDAFPFPINRAGGESRPNRNILELSKLIGQFTDRYFNVRVEGTENIPSKGGAMIVSNHGFLMVESIVFHNVVLRHAKRCIRPVAAHMVWDIPGFNHLAAAAGAVRGDPDTVVSLLKRDELVLIYPGGVREAAKGHADRERLFWENRVGFARAALRARKPIIPAAIKGADDVYIKSERPVLSLSSVVGDKDASMPLFFGVGPFPLPASLVFRFGEPISTEDAGDPDDGEALRALHARAHDAVEALLKRGNAPRPSPQEQGKEVGEPL